MMVFWIVMAEPEARLNKDWYDNSVLKMAEKISRRTKSALLD